MEWRTGAGASSRSVVVPQDAVVSIVGLLGPTGVPIDPYRDRVLDRDSTRTVSARLRSVRDEQAARVADGVRRELGVRELPAWAGKLVEARAARNELLKVCEELIGLCEYALDHDLDVEVRGQ